MKCMSQESSSKHPLSFLRQKSNGNVTEALPPQVNKCWVVNRLFWHWLQKIMVCNFAHLYFQIFVPINIPLQCTYWRSHISQVNLPLHCIWKFFQTLELEFPKLYGIFCCWCVSTIMQAAVSFTMNHVPDIVNTVQMYFAHLTFLLD